MTIRRFAAQGFLLLAVLGYLLPFVALEKNGAVLFTLSGAQLITGETLYTTSAAAEIPPDPCLLGAALLAAIGFFAGFGARRAWLRRIEIIAVAGACAGLLLFPVTTAARISIAVLHAASLRVEMGYWVSLICCLLAIASFAERARVLSLTTDN